jgi:hypothetical protein
MHQLRDQERKLPEQEDQELKFHQHLEIQLFIMIQQINGMLQVVEGGSGIVLIAYPS